MCRKLIFVMSLSAMMILSACGKKESKTTEIEKIEDTNNQVTEIGNGGTQINVDSLNSPGGEEEEKTESDVKVGKKSPDTAVIVIDWDKITVDDNECGDIEEMKEQIIKSGCKKIDLQHTDANKVTLDEVTDALEKIGETLEIEVNYN